MLHIYTLNVFFFYPWKKKVPVKSFFGLFLFFTGKNLFSRPTFWPNFELFHAHFCFLRALFLIFHGEQMSFHGQKLCSYTENFIVLTGIFCIFFTGIILIFTGTLLGTFSRAVFNFHGHFLRVFSGIFTGIYFFHRHKFLFFSRVKICFFTG